MSAPGFFPFVLRLTLACASCTVTAVALYHSGSPGKGGAYWRRVEKLWNAERSRLFKQARQTRIRAFRARRAAGLARAR